MLIMDYLISSEFPESGQTQFLSTVTFQEVGSKPSEVRVNRRRYLPTLSYNIYLSAQSAGARNQCGSEKLWGVDHLTSTEALFSINEFDVGSVAGNDWLVGDVIGLIWHCSGLNSESSTGELQCRMRSGSCVRLCPGENTVVKPE